MRLSSCIAMLLALAVVALPSSTGHAEDAPDLWQGRVRLDLAPGQGREMGSSARGEDLDYSSYSLTLSASRKQVPLVGKITLNVLGSYRPDSMGRGPRSTRRFDLVLGQETFVAHSGRLWERRIEPGDSTWQPWTHVSHTKTWSVCRESEDALVPTCPDDPSGLFAGKTRSEVTLGAGARYTLGKRMADLPLTASVTLSTDRAWSTEGRYSRWTPRALLMVRSKTLKPGIRPYARISYDVRIYDHAWSGMSKARLDRNLQIGAGANFEDWVGLDVDGLSLGVLYYRRKSNREGSDYERGFFSPRLTVSQSF